jgi:hypothetical protein
MSLPDRHSNETIRPGEGEQGGWKQVTGRNLYGTHAVGGASV